MSRELGIPAARASHWRDQFLAAGQAGLKSRAPDARDAEHQRLLDAIFSPSQFGNEIIWSYRRWPSKHPHFQRMHDVILRYWKGGRPTWNQAYEPPSESFIRRFKGRANVLDPGETTKRPADHDTPELPLRDVWQLSIIAPASKERVGYPTQKPLALLDCIIAASSNPGDTLLDPFCGCGTACVSAERLERQWVGIDISEKAAELVQVRIRKEIDLFHDFTPIRRSDIPTRTDLGQIPTTARTSINSSGSRRGTASGAASRSSFATSTWITSSRRVRAAQTTSTTCNCSAGPVTA